MCTFQTAIRINHLSFLITNNFTRSVLSLMHNEGIEISSTPDADFVSKILQMNHVY